MPRVSGMIFPIFSPGAGPTPVPLHARGLRIADPSGSER
jgi:hypothetical protein